MCIFLLSFLLPASAFLETKENFDIVLRNGRVIDPESNFDQIAHVAIKGDKIVQISQDILHGKTVIDVSGMVVSPGFIDLHSHAMSPLGQQLQAQDGVTTALELEAGVFPINALDTLLKGHAVINYGASVGHLAIRQKVFDRVIQPHISMPKQLISDDTKKNEPTNFAFSQVADDIKLAALKELVIEGIEQGGLGIGLLLDYVSKAVNNDELSMIFNVAGNSKIPVFVHIRRGLPGDPNGLKEIIKLAREHKTAVHICHLNASAMKGVDNYLEIIRNARKGGVDISTEAYPYNAGSTAISAAVFDKDWQSIFDITYEDIEWADTGMRFNEQRWNEYREKYPRGQIIHHYGNEQWTKTALLDPLVIIASDAMPIVSTQRKVHPRGIGTFSRVLTRYTNTTATNDKLALGEALKKMTLMPAQRLEKLSRAFANKGRLRTGFDADITVFDPTIVTDRATFKAPIQPSEGIKYVLVGGIMVINDGKLTGNTPGKLILSDSLLSQ
jgi:N-acyl-D-aspartate/D-glutamate deacylase